MSPWSYRPELDGLRMVAVYLVLLFHAGLAGFSGGFVGVDLFFVLSGFLVTHVIWAEIDARGQVSLGGFWSRRVRRLLPAAVLVIVATALIQLLVQAQTTRLDFVGDARAALLYFANWHFLAESRDYFAADTTGGSPYLHFWSLSIEEQFYIAYPLLVVAVLARRPAASAARIVGTSLLGVLTGSLALQLWLGGTDATLAYYATHTRIYQLAAGCLLAMVLRGTWPSLTAHRAVLAARSAGPLLGIAAPVGVLAVLVLGSGLLEMDPSTRGVAVTVASVLAVGGLYARPGALGRALGRPLPRYLGQISYATYLWHWPVILVLREVFDTGPVVVAGLAAVLSTALAALSFRVLESPVRRATLGPRTQWPVVVAGVGISALFAVFLVPVVLESDRRPATAAGPSTPAAGRVAAGALDRPLPDGLDLPAAKSDVPALPPLCTPEDPRACRLVSGTGPHLVLVGDSQARMFLDAFEEVARQRDWTFSASVLPACPWQAELRHRGTTDAEQEKCREGREVFYEEVLPDMDADVVLAVGFSRTTRRWDALLEDVGAESPTTLVQRHLRTARQTVQVVRDAGPRMVIARSLLGTRGFDKAGPDPLDCLARARRLADCAVPVPLAKPYVDGFYETLAAEGDGVATVGFNRAICPGAPLCAPVIDGTVVWRDPNHVTAQILVQRRGELVSRLRATGLLHEG